MDDLISRQAAIDALEREKTYCTAFRDGYAPINVFEKYNAGLTDGIKALKNLPSVERKKGKWIMINDHTARCSSCNEIRWTNGHDQTMKGHIFYGIYKYCPECGAEMESEP